MSHDCNDDCNNYKFISHQIGQYQPRIFAPPFDMNEDGSNPRLIELSTSSCIHIIHKLTLE